MTMTEQRIFASGFSGFCIDLQAIFSFPMLFTEEAKPYCDGLITFNNQLSRRDASPHVTIPSRHRRILNKSVDYHDG
jgi:hypothetical protein